MKFNNKKRAMRILHTLPVPPQREERSLLASSIEYQYRTNNYNEMKSTVSHRYVLFLRQLLLDG